LRTDTGVCIEKFEATAPMAEGEATAGAIPSAVPAAESAEAQRVMRQRYGLEGRGTAETARAQPAATAGTPVTKGASNEVDTISMTFRAVSLTKVSGQPDANKEVFFSVLTELKASPYFVPDETKDTSSISADEEPGTFTFGISAKLRRPLKLF